MSLPQKVCTIDGLQSASPEKFALSTAYNQLPSKNLCCRRLTIDFSQKVFAFDGLQSASLKK